MRKGKDSYWEMIPNREVQEKLASKAVEKLASKAVTQPMELRSAPDQQVASSMEFVLTNTTPGASGKELVSSAEESRIALGGFCEENRGP